MTNHALQRSEATRPLASRAGLLAVALLVLTGCRQTYYSVMETFGYPKRELLKDALQDASKENREAAQQFQDALTQLRELTGFEGGELEKHYQSFKTEFEQCQSKAERVRARVRKVERVANDLFKEWEEEIGQIQTPSLRSDSQAKLQDTRVRYEKLRRALTQCVESMDPVLAQMKDYVLYLKHNLNAQAIGSLKSTVSDIEHEVGELIQSMNQSIHQTEAFWKMLEPGERQPSSAGG